MKLFFGDQLYVEANKVEHLLYYTATIQMVYLSRKVIHIPSFNTEGVTAAQGLLT